VSQPLENGAAKKCRCPADDRLDPDYGPANRLDPDYSPANRLGREHSPANRLGRHYCPANGLDLGLRPQITAYLSALRRAIHVHIDAARGAAINVHVHACRSLCRAVKARTIVDARRDRCYVVCFSADFRSLCVFQIAPLFTNFLTSLARRVFDTPLLAGNPFRRILFDFIQLALFVLDVFGRSLLGSIHVTCCFGDAFCAGTNERQTG
jgi:hypothetical protein